MTKEEAIEVMATVVEPLPNAMFKVFRGTKSWWSCPLTI